MCFFKQRYNARKTCDPGNSVSHSWNREQISLEEASEQAQRTMCPQNGNARGQEGRLSEKNDKTEKFPGRFHNMEGFYSSVRKFSKEMVPNI